MQTFYLYSDVFDSTADVLHCGTIYTDLNTRDEIERNVNFDPNKTAPTRRVFKANREPTKDT